MGTPEIGVLLKKDQQQNHHHLGRVSSLPKQHGPRSRFLRSLLSMRLGYLQWISTIVVFSLFLVFFQAFLPGSVVDGPGSSKNYPDLLEGELLYLKEIGELEFGEYLMFEPSKLLAKFQNEATMVNSSYGSRRGIRFAHRKPKLALVFVDLAVDSHQILMASVAVALQDIGYSIEVFSNEDGPAHSVWQHMGVPVTMIEIKDHSRSNIDWLKALHQIFCFLMGGVILCSYDGVLLNSLQSKDILSCFEMDDHSCYSFMQEPFRSLPLVWTIHEKGLASRLNQYTSNGTIEILNDWKESFNRATVVVFPNYALPMLYSPLDTGNYFVIPGSPTEAWKADSLMVFDQEELHAKMGLEGGDDFVVAVVGSEFMYKGLWVEHALVLQALKPLVVQFPSHSTSSSCLRIFILTGDSTGNYTKAVETISASLNYPKGAVKHADRYANDVLRLADLVIYGSLLEEQSFPDILITAMSLEKLIIAPNLPIIQKYVDDRVNGYLFPKEDIKALTTIISKVVSDGKLSPSARKMASIGKGTAKNLMVAEAVEGYAFLLEHILKLPSEVAAPKLTSEIDPLYKTKWRWDILSKIPDARYRNRNFSSYLDKIEEWSHSKVERVSTYKYDEFLFSIWEEQKQTDNAYAKKRREEDELKARTDQSRGSWDDIYRNSKRASRAKNDVHERDDRELERTGQPLCIYEPYSGEGTWPFLHVRSLYRGVSLATKGQKRESDDVDASSRLPVLKNPYYGNVLGEFGAFFAVANQIDSLHKNAWIGFQSWRATARKEALSSMAETALLKSIEAHNFGDAFYFWIRMDKDPRNPLKQDFWAFCDAINAGNCRSGFSDALKKMYGIKHDWVSLPSMPMDGDTWSVMHSWALPTRSFLEYVMFARMFVDALDAQMYDEHNYTGRCYFSLSKDKQCYSRVLELLINVWAYHSARRMVYVNPETGVMQEHHVLQKRRGLMWMKWFSFQTLKSMDEELAEEADSDEPKGRWLWPLTGEIYWQGTYEKERSRRRKENAEKRKKNKDRIERIRNRNQERQKPIGKYVKHTPEGMSNTPAAVARR
ncbi:hypothetical protein Cgig2_002320 [Carnegiea gigantea]|uniref:Glycosyl transferase family 1 domain-containing protein n=1 Tax=Carnegiea gigantea TaxID=171969 RepID=A0A9Q1Q9P5_9CARY|nr:hypothetical protein Cgig2_002320 [Carnegiea gigantea]